MGNRQKEIRLSLSTPSSPPPALSTAYIPSCSVSFHQPTRVLRVSSRRGLATLLPPLISTESIYTSIRCVSFHLSFSMCMFLPLGSCIANNFPVVSEFPWQRSTVENREWVRPPRNGPPGGPNHVSGETQFSGASVLKQKWHERSIDRIQRSWRVGRKNTGFFLNRPPPPWRGPGEDMVRVPFFLGRPLAKLSWQSWGCPVIEKGKNMPPIRCFPNTSFSLVFNQGLEGDTDFNHISEWF